MNELENYIESEKKRKAANYMKLNQLADKGQIVFTGSSLMEQFPIGEMQQNLGCSLKIYNRGIGGFTTTEMLEHMDEQIFGLEPSKIFINIGTNDMVDIEHGFDVMLDGMIANYRRILENIKVRLPEADVYLMAYYPLNEAIKDSDTVWCGRFAQRSNERNEIANCRVADLARSFGYNYINVNDGLHDEQGQLKAEYTVEGIHMYPNAYAVVIENLKEYL